MVFIVQKLGGSVLKSDDRFDFFARQAEQITRAGHRLLVVVSAQKGETDRLIRKAKSIYPLAKGPALDLFLSLGEQRSCAMFGMALQARGISMVIKSGTAIGIRRLVFHQHWKVDKRDYLRALENHVVVVSGFQALDENNTLVTLGRGGSDLTALLLAHFLKADVCRLVKDVPGIANPNDQRKPKVNFFNQLSFKELVALSSRCSRIVQPQAVIFASHHRVNFQVTDDQGQGTWVGSPQNFPPIP
jgi:aspartate kinase